MSEVLQYNPEDLITIEVGEKTQEECGIVALFNNDENTAIGNIQIALAAAYGLQHRGQHGAGGVYWNSDGQMVVRRRDGLLKDCFTNPLTDTQAGEIPFNLSDRTLTATLQTRYGSKGGYATKHLQPCTGITVHGEEFAVVANGQFTGINAMKQKLSYQLSEDPNDTFIYARKVAETPGKNRDEIIMNAVNEVNGAFSMAILFKDAVYVARDEFGLRPYWLGKIGENGWVAASETHALEKIRVETVGEVKRDSILRFDARGITTLREGKKGPGNFCAFEHPYFSRPDSLYASYDDNGDLLSIDDLKTELEFRELSGEIMSKEAPLDLDVVIGIPDSGVPMGIGYARGSGIPYAQWIMRDHFDTNSDQRLFQGDNEMHAIIKKVIRKLSVLPKRSLWNGKRVGLVDDSIVRGNVSAQLTHVLQDLGAKEVHWISGFPPVRHTCHLGVSMRTHEELIAARHKGNLQAIADEIGATSINYITPDQFIFALNGIVNVGFDPNEIFLNNGLCGGCTNGTYPISEEGVIYKSRKGQFN